MILNKKQRQTPQKTKIMEYLSSTSVHPTAEVVYKQVKKQIPSITLATVYRNLNQAADNEEIIRLEINGEYHYDALLQTHQHCVCDDCGNVFDICNPGISKKALQLCKLSEFSPKSVTIIFRGKCKKCKGKKNGSKNK